MKRDMEQMTHWVQELRAPLGNLMGQLELHREEMAPECFGQLWEDCQNLRENVEQVLELVSMRLGDRLPQWGAVRLQDCMDQALKAKRPLGERMGVFFRCEYAQEDYKIWTDGGMIREILEQLLHHAVQYSAVGNGVTLGMTVHSEDVSLWVENQGPEFIYMPQKLKEYFTQEETMSSGMRIEICRCLAGQLGGALFSESSMRGGIRMGIRLPAAG